MPLCSPNLVAALLAAVLWVSPAVLADDLRSISQLAGQGQHGPALDRVNSYLAVHPGDVQGQFLKGVILAEQGKASDAIRVFSDITGKHPELPEPYNNLAVLYADQGQYDKARHALEMAIKTHPSYATAHENLGDVYAKMASDAYDKALQLDKNNARTQTKLAMVKELFSGTRPVAGAVKPESPARVTIAPPVATPVAATEQLKAGVPPPVEKAREPKEKSDVPDKPVSQEPNGPGRGVEDAVKGWARAWSAQDADAYLAYYGAGFSVPGGENREAWEKSRRARIGAPASIKVELAGIKVRMEGDDRATVSFRQSYRAGNVARRTSKSLALKKAGGKWYIEQELTDR